VIKEINIIILYAEITNYLLGSLYHLIDKNSSIKLHIVYNNVFSNINILNKQRCNFFDKSNFKNKDELLRFCNNLNPSILLVSGRMFSDYLYVSKKMKSKTIRVTVQDTMFQPSLKQFMIKALSTFMYFQYFDKFWGIGVSQTRFAKYIGFDDKDILHGFYVADKKFFSRSKIFSYENFNLNILFIGRLVKEKNILKLIEIVEKINTESGSSHKITIIGAGYLVDKVKESDIVNYHGVRTQEEIINIALECDVFCLPSIYEPWGVVTHEMSALGMPVISSELCGSSYDLVIDGYNGYKFNPHDDLSIKKALENFISLSNIRKKEYSANSIKISKKINHDIWNQSILSLIN